ncbi:MAG: hydrogenase formation protein HypD [Bacteroidales bacterium]|nr:hydrogenase formation protein HypD [Bacteroidales bacterium]
MKFVDEYRKKDLILALSARLAEVSHKEIRLMEVCGGHTMAIHRFGLHSLLPPNIKLLSGPGCPVCVSGRGFIDQAMAYASLPDVTIATYGDLIRVPGSDGSLEKSKAEGRDVKIVYSALDAVELARTNPNRRIIFLGIGFETTAPATAAAIIQAEESKLGNFLVLSAHKIMPPVMKALVQDKVRIDGFIAPGHVTAITGTDIYNFLTDDFGLGVVVAGFEPTDLLQSIIMLAQQFEAGKPAVEIQYNRVVSPHGNPKAWALLNEAFELRDDNWRGLGTIPGSGLKINSKYSVHDAEVQIPLDLPEAVEPKGCICGSILRGLKTPNDCGLFAKKCTPSTPVGACMVSGEGTCATYYKYRS